MLLLHSCCERPALGQQVFLLRFQHGDTPDFPEIPGKTGFSTENRQSRGMGHDSAFRLLPVDRRAIAPVARLENKSAMTEAPLNWLLESNFPFLLPYSPAYYGSSRSQSPRLA